MRKQRRVLTIASVLLLSLLVAACGSRITPEQRAAVLGNSGGQPGGGVGAAGAPSGSASPGAGGAGSTVGASGAGADGGGGGGSGGSGSGGSGGGSGGSGNSGNSGDGSLDVACEGSGGSTDTGVTGDSITIANISDISGPVPGLFEDAQLAVKAFVSYFNSTHGRLCGRALQLETYDSRTDSGGDREATLRACQQAFALVGSMSAFDQGGAEPAADCGIPDIRTASTTKKRQQTPVSFGTKAVYVKEVPAVLPNTLKKRFGNASQKAAYVYLNAQAPRQNYQAFSTAFEKAGFNYIYEQGIDVSEYNYAPYVVEMKQQGVEFVQWLGDAQHGARLAKAMAEQNFEPEAFVMDTTAYTDEFVNQAGSAADGLVVYTDAALLEEMGSNPEMQRYSKWLAQVAPDAEPTYFGLFAWGAARLFVREAADVGPELTRQALVEEIKGVHEYTGNGLFSPQNVGGKHTAKCQSFIQLQGGEWSRITPDEGYHCGGLIQTGQ